MSETELHIGKLRKIDLKLGQTLEDFYKEKLKEVDVLKLRSYDNDWLDAFLDEYHNKYIVVNNIIYEIYEHEEKNPYRDINILNKNADGTYSFTMMFYNGGTCLSECLEDEILKLK